MAFWNESDNIEINKITTYLEREFPNQDYEKYILSEIDDNTFIDATLIKSWSHFQYLFKFELDNLNEFTPFNQKHLQNRAKPTLDILKTDKEHFLSYLMRVIHEYYFWNPVREELPDIISSDILTRLSSLTKKKSYTAQFSWIENSMATAITRDLINSEDFISIRAIAKDVANYKKIITSHKEKSTTEYIETVKNLSETLEESIEKTNSTKSELADYDAKLEGYKAKYNFVLLSKSFNNLHIRKSEELNKAKKLTWRFTMALALPPSFAFFNHIYNWFPSGEGFSSLSFYLPILTFEILIFYFMRLYYSEVRALNTQLLQIDHRLSLCEFIHDYIEKKNADKDNKESWDLFESLIFSPIQITPDNIPSVLDGANAVAELAGKVMAKSKV